MIKLSDFLKALLKFTIVNRVSLLFILIPMTAANSVNVHTGDPFSQLALGKGCGQILERNWLLIGVNDAYQAANPFSFKFFKNWERINPLQTKVQIESQFNFSRAYQAVIRDNAGEIPCYVLPLSDKGSPSLYEPH